MKNKIVDKQQTRFGFLIPLLLLSLVAIWIIYAQMLTGNILVGADTIFHFNRFYEAAQQLKHQNFSWFMSIYGYNQSGRIVNGVYGPLLAYLLGGLLLIVGKWYRFQIITSFFIYVIAGEGMYLVSRRLKVNRVIATLVGIIYMTIGWVPRWEMGTNFSAITGVLAPYILLVALNMIQDRQRPVHWLALTAIMTIAIECHLLTAAMAMILLVPAWLYALINHQQQRLQICRDTLQAVGLTILLTLNVLAPLFYISFTNHLIMPRKMNMASNVMSIVGPSSSWLEVFTAPNTRGYISCGLLSLLVIQMLLAWRLRRQDRLNFALTVYGTVVLFCSSGLFPWRLVSWMVPSLARNFQFPARLLCIAYPLLLLGLARSSQWIVQQWPAKFTKPLTYLILLVTCLATVGSLRNQLTQYSSTGYMPKTHGRYTYFGWNDSKYDMKITQVVTHDMDPFKFLDNAYKSFPDYLAGKTKKITAKQATLAYGREILNSSDLFEKQAVKYGQLKITWIAERDGQKEQLPVVTYQQSRLVINNRTVQKYSRSSIGTPTVKSHRGLNTAYLSFVVPQWLTLLITISIIADFVTVMIVLMNNLRKISH